MKEFLISFLFFLAAISAISYLCEKEPKVIEIPVESPQLKEENANLKKQLEDTSRIIYETVYVQELKKEELQKVKVQTRQIAYAQPDYIPEKPVREIKYLSGKDMFEPNRIDALSGSDRFRPAPPCGCE